MTPPRHRGAPRREVDAVDDPKAFFDLVLTETALLGGDEPLDTTDVGSLLTEYYGLSGILAPIATEKDDTFRLTTERDDTYLVKVSPAEEDPAIVDLQTSAMLYLAEHAPTLPVQRVVRTVSGADHVELPARVGPYPRILRVMEFIRGTTLSNADPSLGQLRAAGTMLGRLSAALEAFEHPADRRLVLWDLANFHRLGVLRDYVTDSRCRDLTDHVFAEYDNHVVPVLDSLETRVIHGDFSPFNVVVDAGAPDYVTGIIDFGDTVRSALIFDVTVGMANQLDARLADPWDKALAFLAGYRAVVDLPPAHISLLSYTVPARLLMRSLVAAWRATQNPERHEYLMSHANSDWENLASALQVPISTVDGRLQATEDHPRSAFPEEHQR